MNSNHRTMRKPTPLRYMPDFQIFIDPILCLSEHTNLSLHFTKEYKYILHILAI